MHIISDEDADRMLADQRDIKALIMQADAEMKIMVARNATLEAAHRQDGETIARQHDEIERLRALLASLETHPSTPPVFSAVIHNELRINQQKTMEKDGRDG